jgi:hypothetical protein
VIEQQKEQANIVETKSSKSSDKEKLCPPEKSSLYSEDGVDLSLIRWMLSLTPAERLQVLQQNVRSIIRLRSESIKKETISDKDKATLMILERTLEQKAEKP